MNCITLNILIIRPLFEQSNPHVHLSVRLSISPSVYVHQEIRFPVLTLVGPILIIDIC